MRGFTLTEMIFVIVVIGILSMVGVYYFPKTRAISDAEIVKFKIMQTKSNALGYNIKGDNNYTCITLSKDALNENEKNNSENVKYMIKSEIEITGMSGDKLCFDSFGRPYDGVVDDNLSNLLKQKVTITIKSDREKNLTLYPISGFIR